MYTLLHVKRETALKKKFSINITCIRITVFYIKGISVFKINLVCTHCSWRPKKENQVQEETVETQSLFIIHYSRILQYEYVYLRGREDRSDAVINNVYNIQIILYCIINMLKIICKHNNACNMYTLLQYMLQYFVTCYFAAVEYSCMFYNKNATFICAYTVTLWNKCVHTVYNLHSIDYIRICIINQLLII